MANNMMTFQSEFIDCKKSILIPLLQRDYVQGGRVGVIVPFVEQLISALQDKITINLNYIYGYDGENGFIPIDGQQRLITLWLLHLYIYAKKSLDFPVELKFESREFAENFSIKLSNNLSDILKSEVNLKKSIIDSSWFVSCWLYDNTVTNMLNALDLIHNRIGNTEINIANTKNIIFDFLNMKDKGLDDDVYVKMNGRGRPLSYFENLKSWMDEQVKTIFGREDPFTKEWRIKMDNDWTDLFWANRNKNQEHPEEIDDEQLRLFYSLLLLYWKKNESSFDRNKSNEKEKIFQILLECKEVISLYQIEQLSLFNKNVFLFIRSSLETLNNIFIYLNKLPSKIINILDFDKADTTVLYKIALKEATYVKTLPLLYALIKTPNFCFNNKELDKWIRIWRNLILNSSIDNKNIGAAINTIDLVSNQLGENENIYTVVAGLKWEKGFGFSESQFIEEIAKAKQIVSKKFSEEDMIEAENHPLLKGCISCLFGDDNCCAVSFDQTIIDRVAFLDRLYNESDNCDYTLFKVLISRYKNKKLEERRSLELKKNKYNWKILVTDKLKDCFRESKDDSIYESDKTWIKILSQTNLIENSRDSGKILGTYCDKIVLWGTEGCTWNAYGNVILDEVHNNNILANLIDKKEIECNQKIQNCAFFDGWNINFKYKNYYFQWYGNPNEKELDIYLMEGEWKDYKKRTNHSNDKGTDEENHYCFRVTSDMKNNISLFTNELDNLINDAKKNSDF